ncbi:MAG: NEW3 domain-containing protein [Enterocloster sp.]
MKKSLIAEDKKYFKNVHSESMKRGARFLAAFCMASALWAGSAVTAWAAGGLELNSDYPGISVKPGDNLSIPITVSNESGAGMDADVSLASLPEGWEGYIQGGSYQVNRVHVQNGGNGTSLTLHVKVPEELEEGDYRAVVHTSAGEGAQDDLELVFSVTEQNAGKGSFSSEYPEQEGASGTNFSFSTTLINNGLKEQSYSLSSNAPAGWTVSFSPSSDSSKKVAGIDVDSSSSQGINVSVVPPENAEAGEYSISCSAVSAEETLTTDLKVKITGTYKLELSTSDGRLSFDAHAGQKSEVTLQVTNSGNVDLENVTINSSAPSGWVVTYNTDDNVIGTIPAGTTKEVVASVKPGSDAITGDYVTSFTVSNEDTSAKADFRVSVKTTTLWGVVAILVILCTAGVLRYVFRKYGRR